jgi:hypothetical protein
VSYQQASIRPPFPASTIRFGGCISSLSHRSRVLVMTERIVVGIGGCSVFGGLGAKPGGRSWRLLVVLYARSQ